MTRLYYTTEQVVRVVRQKVNTSTPHQGRGSDPPRPSRQPCSGRGRIWEARAPLREARARAQGGQGGGWAGGGQEGNEGQGGGWGEGGQGKRWHFALAFTAARRRRRRRGSEEWGAGGRRRVQTWGFGGEEIHGGGGSESGSPCTNIQEPGQQNESGRLPSVPSNHLGRTSLASCEIRVSAIRERIGSSEVSAWPAVSSVSASVRSATLQEIDYLRRTTTVREEEPVQEHEEEEGFLRNGWRSEWGMPMSNANVYSSVRMLALAEDEKGWLTM
ncbi:hypothetical protein MARPO_0186s0002 [Marchantia polymorpha]|uniref:Uncharacterized protein n=1 Tax=Marchantia polymorpha TaxID=3197 RepID=A0A2R6W1H7_MARPO|nr:hypothetical protein MARPO_0186s0002 [Marchantia polymorpha]|eukprot:PTQ27701.1 hypothetical protein MARPO_0186s0002 [Marchantia polymorpha]